jgi:hypothetical protein
MFHSDVWRTCLREISKEGPTLCAKTIWHQIIRYSHLIQMNYRFALKNKSISRPTDGAKRGNKHFYVVVANTTRSCTSSIG